MTKGTIKRECLVCKKSFVAIAHEIKRGGGKVCSRVCYYKHQKRTRPTGEKAWAWKGDRVGISALHGWVIKHLGRPRKCEHCKTTKASMYDWANKSRKYKRLLSDWMRLCRACHVKYDYVKRIKKWRVAVRKLGWKTK